MSHLRSPQPLISVVIPTYNYASTLARAAQSVLGQLGDDSELLIIDDGSTDATPGVIDALQLGYPERFRAFRKDNGGAAAARNFGLSQSRGLWLVFLDADDQMVGDALRALTAHINAHPRTRMIIGGHFSVFADGRRRQHEADLVPDEVDERVRAYLIDKRLAISNGACAMHRDVFDLGNYPEQFRNSEDIPVFAQALAGYPVSRIETPLALIHKHDDSLRHNLVHGQAVGLRLVDEVFSRLPKGVQGLRNEFYVQRCLSLFRSAYRAGDRSAARYFFHKAYKADWRVLIRFSYSRKWLSTLLSGGAKL